MSFFEDAYKKGRVFIRVNGSVGLHQVDTISIENVQTALLGDETVNVILEVKIEKVEV